MDRETFYEDEQWDLVEEDFEPLERSWWRRSLLILIASITAVALAIVPIYNIFWASPPVADNGLEVCGFDYCVVQDAVREAGLGDSMASLSGTFLSDDEARSLANSLVKYLDIDPVGLTVINNLAGDLEGQYDPATRLIEIERPARAWTVAHEVAHAEVRGHGDDFQQVLIDLAEWLSSGD